MHFLFYRQCSMSKNVVSPNQYGSFMIWFTLFVYLVDYFLKAKNPGRNFLQWYYATIFIYVIFFKYYYNFLGRVFILKGGICRYKWENVWVLAHGWPSLLLLISSRCLTIQHINCRIESLLSNGNSHLSAAWALQVYCKEFGFLLTCLSQCS